MKKERIIWLSRHAPLELQREELEGIYPGCTVIEDGRTFDSVASIMRRVHEARATVICTTGLPLSMVERLLEVAGDIPVIRPVVKPLNHPAPDDPACFTYRHRWYRHLGYERVLGIHWDTYPLKPATRTNGEVNP